MFNTETWKTYPMKELIGKVFTSVEKNTNLRNYDDRDNKGSAIWFKNEDEFFELSHDQDCCEEVDIEDISGDLNDLVNTSILDSYCSTSKGKTEWDSCTWSFYIIRTVKGTVTIRFYGTSNGCYSEEASLRKYPISNSG